jgi:peptidoglycan/xylan/chitin deacetylase (PgdA/CDA1 family)
MQAGRSVVGLVLVLAACGQDAGASAPRRLTGRALSRLSFPDGDDGGYCASSPSPQCSTGTPLDAKQLVFTFDDGPGSRTLALSSYLKSVGIRATFFVNGHCFGQSVLDNGQCQQDTAATPADIFTELVADGHLVANHTQDHLDLTDTGIFPPGAAGDRALIEQLVATDTLIAPFVSNFIFRAPYGAWSARDYGILHASSMDKYVGPVSWDIGGAMVGQDSSAPGSYAADWDCWQDNGGFGVQTTQQCGDRYLHEIGDIGRGIVLMHDADYGDVTNHDISSGQGNTIDMVKYLLEGNDALGVTGLVAQGYTFVRVDEVPDVAAALP